MITGGCEYEGHKRIRSNLPWAGWESFSSCVKLLNSASVFPCGHGPSSMCNLCKSCLWDNPRVIPSSILALCRGEAPETNTWWEYVYAHVGFTFDMYSLVITHREVCLIVLNCITPVSRRIVKIAFSNIHLYFIFLQGVRAASSSTWCLS